MKSQPNLFGEKMKRILFILFTTFFVGTAFAQQSLYKNISWNTAIETQKHGGIFLDVRTPEEVAQGTVAGSTNIPLQELSHRTKELQKGKPIFVFCRSGVRSQKASALLSSQGFTVYNIEGGFLKAPPASAFK